MCIMWPLTRLNSQNLNTGSLLFLCSKYRVQVITAVAMLSPKVKTSLHQGWMAVCRKCWSLKFSGKVQNRPWTVGTTTHLQHFLQTSASLHKILSDPENKGQQQRGVNFDTLGSWNNRLSLKILIEESIKKGKLIPKIPLEEVGRASLIGRRKVNEDRMVVKELENNLLYVGIFDGHSSAFAADYVVEYLEHHIRYWLSKTSALDVVLHKSFLGIHNVLARHLTHYFMGESLRLTDITYSAYMMKH